MPANLVQDGVLADEDEEDEAAAQQVEAADQPEDELEAGVAAVLVVGVDQVVHALEYPGDPHHDEQLRVQNLPHHVEDWSRCRVVSGQPHHLLPQVAVGLVLAGAGGAAGADPLPAVPSSRRPHVGPGTVAQCLNGTR